MLRLSSILVLLFAASAAFAQSGCGWNPDYNNDNTIGVADLLGLLGVFEEQDSDGDGIFDSQDDCVGVYDACGVCGGTGIDVDEDGVCDDVDDCVGAYDACGVCNGPGPDWPVVESIEQFFDSVYIDQIDVWYVFQTGADTTFSYVCNVSGCTNPAASNFNPEAVTDDGSCIVGAAACDGQTHFTYDGHTYGLVAIGDQCWFAENLRNAHYANGESIPGELPDAAWSTTTDGARSVYGEGTSTCVDGPCDEVSNYAALGNLYNFYAVTDDRGLCPTGWHVPTDAEWKTLEKELGMTTSQANAQGYRGTDQGDQLKASAEDAPGWDGSNASGFSALAGGFRNVSGSFEFMAMGGVFWTSSPYGAEAWFRDLYSEMPTVGRSTFYLRNGFSVRCLLDS